jgi:hypothetical protein
MTNLQLSNVPETTVAGETYTDITLTGTSGQSWTLSASPTGLIISPYSGTFTDKGKATVPLTIKPLTTGQFTIVLSGQADSLGLVGTVTTVAIHPDPVVQRYVELLADLETLKF